MVDSRLVPMSKPLSFVRPHFISYLALCLLWGTVLLLLRVCNAASHLAVQMTRLLGILFPSDAGTMILTLRSFDSATHVWQPLFIVGLLLLSLPCNPSRAFLKDGPPLVSWQMQMRTDRILRGIEGTVLFHTFSSHLHVRYTLFPPLLMHLPFAREDIVMSCFSFGRWWKMCGNAASDMDEQTLGD
jgi:hypothetical protein